MPGSFCQVRVHRLPKEVSRRLAGEVHMLNQRAAWEAGGQQAINDRPMPTARKKKK